MPDIQHPNLESVGEGRDGLLNTIYLHVARRPRGSLDVRDFTSWDKPLPPIHLLKRSYAKLTPAWTSKKASFRHERRQQGRPRGRLKGADAVKFHVGIPAPAHTLLPELLKVAERRPLWGFDPTSA